MGDWRAISISPRSASLIESRGRARLSRALTVACSHVRARHSTTRDHSVNQLKRYAALFLLGAMTLALMTPAYLIHVRPGSAVYHRNPYVFASQVIPYAVCAALWLPVRTASAAKIAFGLSTALFVAACLLYVPIFLHPELVGGDMVGLGYILVCLVTTAAVVAISIIAAIVVATRRRFG
jgi:hypothetical protein